MDKKKKIFKTKKLKKTAKFIQKSKDFAIFLNYLKNYQSGLK